MQAAVVSVLQNLMNEVNTGFRTRMNLFIKISLNQSTKPFFALNSIKIDHFLSFQWQS